MATMTIYHPDRSKVETTRAADDKPTLRELQAAVGGGLIEAVDRFLEEGVEAYANEEGRVRGMSRNHEGQQAVHWPYPLVGPVVVLRGFQEDED